MRKSRLNQVSLAVTSASLLMLSGCAKINLSGQGPMTHPTPSGKRQLLSEPPLKRGTSAASDRPAPKSTAVARLAGHWQIGFVLGKNTLTSSFDLTQDGNSFHGRGSDDHDHKAFVIENGSLSDNQVAFTKNYQDGKSVPVNYVGTFEMADRSDYKGPYMAGNYQVVVQGRTISGEWQAEEISPAQAQAPEPPPPQDEPAPHAAAPNHAPQLSGKWNAGYEYNFKTIHSTMYLEQDGGKVSGHGYDEESKEKFVIAKGWYNFPHLTLVRKYAKGKGGAGEREVTFKADVSWVNDPDYEGPYLNGKTQGGGSWEAQLLK